MSKAGLQQFQQTQQQYSLANLRNPGWGSHVTVPGQSFCQTTPLNSMYGNIWNQMPYYDQSPLYCNVNYAALGGYSSGCNNIFGINYGYNMYGMNEKSWNSYNNAMSSGYNLSTAQNKVGTALTWVNGIGGIADGITNTMGSVANLFSNLGGFTSVTTETPFNVVGGAAEGVTNGVKKLGSFFSGLFS